MLAEEEEDAVKRGYSTQQRNKTPPSFSSQPLHGNFITHQSQARFAHLVLLPSAFQPAEVLLETSTMLSLVEVAFSTQGLCRLCFGWNVPFYWNGGGEGQRETRWQKEGVIKKGRKQSAKERKD